MWHFIVVQLVSLLQSTSVDTESILQPPLIESLELAALELRIPVVDNEVLQRYCVYEEDREELVALLLGKYVEPARYTYQEKDCHMARAPYDSALATAIIRHFQNESETMDFFQYDAKMARFYATLLEVVRWNAAPCAGDSKSKRVYMKYLHKVFQEEDIVEKLDYINVQLVVLEAFINLV